MDVSGHIVELPDFERPKGHAAFGLFCEYFSENSTTLSEHANSALEWIVENRTGDILIGGTTDDGYVYLVIAEPRDATLFKTFWL